MSGVVTVYHYRPETGACGACWVIKFAYAKLYEQANFSAISSTAKNAFEALGTQDFEKAIKALRDTSKIVASYGGPQLLSTACDSDADALREILVQTIASSHPSWPGELSNEEYKACRDLIAHFDFIYTLNYDLLLYWAQLHRPDGERPSCDDGFRTPEGNSEVSYVAWEPGNSRKQTMWFLHGALHIFDTGLEVQKYTWSKTGVRLIDQIRDALSRNYFPLFVSEGTRNEKYERIRHSDYLAKAYRSFSSIQGALFVYGHSLAENDDHYLQCIRRGKVPHLYIALYGDPSSGGNTYIMRRAQQLANNLRSSNPLDITYFDAVSAKVWG